MSGNTCQCGKPIHDTANICPHCATALADALDKISDRWTELEDALSWREAGPAGEQGKAKHGMVAVGSLPSDKAMTARRAATNAVFFIMQVLRDDFDDIGRDFNPPRVKADQDGTPHLAHWIACWHLTHISHHTARETAEEILNDILDAEKLTYQATHPSGVRLVPVNLDCEEHATSELGERIPCPGKMWALVGKDVMPDLECDQDGTHQIAPEKWQRLGWKKRHQQIHPEGAKRLLSKMLA